MSNDPVAPARGHKVRWIITACLLVLAVLCVGWIVSLKTSGQRDGSPLLFLFAACLIVPALG